MILALLFISFLIPKIKLYEIVSKIFSEPQKLGSLDLDFLKS